MHKLLIISGPTASGKTSLGFQLAKKLDGEIVSADSRQVYREMDVVTGKEVNKEIKTWLLDVVNPNELFNVADYYEQAWIVINNIWKREKLPIVVGGTGFYIKALLDGIGTMGIEPDLKLRRKLETLSVEQLQKRLQEIDSNRWQRMNESDRKNPRRLIRAIEIATNKHEARSTKFETNSNVQKTNDKNISDFDIRISDFLWIGLKAPFDFLYQRIDERVENRLQMGAIEETKKLAKKYGWDIASMTGQGYRQLRDYIEGKISRKKAIEKWKFAEHEYARRQMTWFKKEKRIVWFDISEKNFLQEVQLRVEEWYT